MSEFYDDPRGRIARDRLLSVVRNQLGHEPFTANSLLDLLWLIEQGAANMVANDELDPEDMNRAESAAVGLLQELSNIRLQDGFPFFTEESINAVRIQLCPGFWPFC